MARNEGIYITLDENVKDFIERIGARKGLTVNMMIRTILYDWMAEQPKEAA